MQVRRAMALLERLKGFWETISAAEWGRDLRAGAAAAGSAEAVLGWTEAMEEERLKRAKERYIYPHMSICTCTYMYEYIYEHMFMNL